jgi:hypothetical protein
MDFEGAFGIGEDEDDDEVSQNSILDNDLLESQGIAN